ncbi:MAG: hypothetical protein JO360_09030, partial [Acidobacteria bacterium]|nr:hypothetical protein [Acidobacteriota bacterium]
MMSRRLKTSFLLISAIGLMLMAGLAPPPRARAQQSNSAQELAGLWEAKNRFGPDVRGSLTIRQTDDVWEAEIAGHAAQARLSGAAIRFELAGGAGEFEGQFDARRNRITGHWIQPATVQYGSRFVSPVTLDRAGRNSWRGEVAPLDDALTFYLLVKQRVDGSVGAFLRNPERNLGRFIRVDHLERDGNVVKLFAADTAGEKGRALALGKYDAESGVISFYFQGRGGSYDFRRVGADEASDFYP